MQGNAPRHYALFPRAEAAPTIVPGRLSTHLHTFIHTPSAVRQAFTASFSSAPVFMAALWNAALRRRDDLLRSPPLAPEPLPPFRPGARLFDLYDMSTVAGRWRYNWALLSPLGLRWGLEEVAEANAVLDGYAAGGRLRSDRELWHATAVLATAAPGGELLPLPLRGCGWTACNIPIIAFMVVSALRHPTCIRRIVLGQWLNQTHLAGITWFNRGADGADGAPGRATVLASYVFALATAIPIAVGGGRLSQQVQLLKPFARFAPYPAVASANFLGCACMRSTDVTQGVPVVQPGDDPAAPALGLSRAAGAQAVRDTCVTRLLMPVGNFLIVPAVAWLYTALRRIKQPSIATQVAVTAAVFTFWLPTAASFYPPVGRLAVVQLEPPLRAELELRARRLDRPVPEHVEYQRGV